MVDASLGQDRAVVIGAGIGGLAAAIDLAARGIAVTVFEKATTPGGKARMVDVSGTAVDGGPTVFTKRDVFDDLFAGAGATLDDHVRLSRPEILARHSWRAGESLDLPDDASGRADAIGDFAGTEAARGYVAFASAAQRVHDLLDANFMRASKVWPPGLMARIGLWRIGDLMALRPYESLWKVLGEYFPDPRLRQLFGRYATYCGSSPFDAPSTLMLIAHTEADGVWLVDGGLSALAEAMANVAAGCGVDIRYGDAVTHIDVSAGRASAVRTASGTRFAAGAVVCNADPAALAAGHFGADAVTAVRPLPRQRRSLSAVVWSATGRARVGDLSTHNVFFSGDYPAEFAALKAGCMAAEPSVYLCALDRRQGRAPPDSERFQVIVNAPPTGDTHKFDSGEITRCTDAMLERLKRCGLQLEFDTPPVVTTPQDFEALFPSTGGALYGRASHGWAAAFLRQSARTRIPGLYCAGGATHPGAGVPMAALSGRLAAATLLRDRASIRRFHPVATPGGTSMPSATTVVTG
jgi:1-hydroxycarotenoid 3,4-desaturase